MSLEQINTASPQDVQATFCAVLVEEWVEQGVTLAMLAPGSRSTPLALALMANRAINVHVFLDERSAAFAALGAGLTSDIPALVLCTSGTAATHFHAAVVEADLSGVPLLVITADRPPELQNVGAPQTIHQTNLYGPAVRWFHDPGVASVVNVNQWRSLAAQCIQHTRGLDPGPVHLNVPFREPLVGTPLGLGHSIRQPFAGDDPARVTNFDLQLLAQSLPTQRGLILVGRGGGSSVAIDALSQATGWPVLAEPRSGCRALPNVVLHFDSLLRHRGFAADHAPCVVIRFGEAPASKVLNQWIAASGAVQCHVSRRQAVYDPDHLISFRVVAEPDDVCLSLAEHLGHAKNTEWLESWVSADKRARSGIAHMCDSARILTATAATRAMVQTLPKGSHLVVSSSMPIRDLEWFGGDTSHLHVHANRGANGIDGVVATAIGVALACGTTTGVLIGDVALLHDSSSLSGLQARQIDIRILVTDNDGGAIFHFLPQATSVAENVFEKLFGTPHGTDIVHLAQAHGLQSQTIAERQDLVRALSQPGPSVWRVATQRQADVANHGALHSCVARELDQLFL